MSRYIIAVAHMMGFGHFLPHIPGMILIGVMCDKLSMLSMITLFTDG